MPPLFKATPVWYEQSTFPVCQQPASEWNKSSDQITRESHGISEHGVGQLREDFSTG